MNKTFNETCKLVHITCKKFQLFIRSSQGNSISKFYHTVIIVSRENFLNPEKGVKEITFVEILLVKTTRITKREI